MADDVTLPGTGAVIATDDVSGRHIQIVKAAWGEDGTANQTSLTNPLPVQSQPIVQAATTGNITGNSQTVAVTLNGATGLIATHSGTFSTVNVTFEATSDGTNWLAIAGGRADSHNVATSTGNVSTSNIAWRFNVAGFTQFRVRSTAYTSGTQVWTFAPSQGDIPSMNSLGTVGINGTVTVSNAATTNLIGDVSPGVRTTATNAALVRNIVSAASTNATNVKSSAGRVYGWVLGNSGAGWRFLKLHNTSGTPTAGTGVINTIGIPPGGSVQLYVDTGYHFATGISFTIVANPATGDATGIGADEVFGSLWYS